MKERAEEDRAARLARREKLRDALKTVVECLGEDPQREGLLRTPERYADAMLFMTQGYEQSLEGMCSTGALTGSDRERRRF